MDLIHSTYNIRLPDEPKICILGLLETLEADTPIFLAISRMLFQARKLIAYHWLRPSPPTLREYVALMNHIIRLERGVYLKRKASHKYEAIWFHGWMRQVFQPRSYCKIELGGWHSEYGGRSLHLLCYCAAALLPTLTAACGTLFYHVMLSSSRGGC